MADEEINEQLTPTEMVNRLEQIIANYQIRIKNQKEALDRLMAERSSWIKQVAELKEENRNLRAQLQGGREPGS